MCFDHDSRPPIAPIAGGALDSERTVLTAADGTRSLAFRARPGAPSGSAILILPDVRGLHKYYEELALRFAEAGVDALAIDYFGRTAGPDVPRDETFDFGPHIDATSWDGLRTDIRTGLDELRGPRTEPAGPTFVVGFCFGGRQAFLAPTLGLGLAGAIGFYGRTMGDHPSGMPAPVDVAGSSACPVLGLFGGADPGIPPEAVEAYEQALSVAGIEHRLVTFDGAPHSVFDSKASDFADASTAAWAEVLGFIEAHS
jgi:carboxymethylenebutenolidase